MPLSPVAPALWVGAVQSSLGVILHSGWPRVIGYLRTMFTATPGAAAPLDVVRALAEGLVAGLAHGLALGAAAQSFAWPFLFGRAAVLPGAAPGAWDAATLGAAAGLAWLLWDSWRAAWMRRAGAPSVWTLGAAAIPCALLELRLGGWAERLEAGAAVGLLLVVTGRTLRLAERWSADPPSASAALPPWLALCGGLVAGLGALPGLSAVALLLVAGLYGRLSPGGAARFALMAATAVLAVRGLAGVPALVTPMQVSYVPLAIAAAVGAAAGGALLLRLLEAGEVRALPVLSSYCTALGGLLLVFGVLQR